MDSVKQAGGARTPNGVSGNLKSIYNKEYQGKQDKGWFCPKLPDSVPLKISDEKLEKDSKSKFKIGIAVLGPTDVYYSITYLVVIQFGLKRPL